MKKETGLMIFQYMSGVSARMRYGMVVLTCLVQFTMGGLLLFAPKGASGATAASPVVALLQSAVDFVGHWPGGGARLAGLLMVLAVVLAVWGLAKDSGPGVKSFFKYSAAQQITLAVSAGGSFSAIITSSYADGVPRPWAFIGTDQAIYVWAFVLYTVAQIGHHFVGVLFEIVLEKNGEPAAPPQIMRRPAP